MVGSLARIINLIWYSRFHPISVYWTLNASNNGFVQQCIVIVNMYNKCWCAWKHKKEDVHYLRCSLLHRHWSFTPCSFDKIHLCCLTLFHSFIMVRNIPVIDFADFDSDPKKVAGQVLDACKSIGFFYIINHDLPKDQIDKSFQVVNDNGHMIGYC